MVLNYREYIPVIVFVILIVLSFFIVQPFLTAIFLGMLLAYICHPFYNIINNKIKSENISALLVCTVLFLLVVVPSFFFVQTLVKESYYLFATIKQVLARGLVLECNNHFCELINKVTTFPEIETYVHDYARLLTNWIIQKGSDFVVSLPSLMISGIIFFFSLFYFLKEGETFVVSLSNYFLVKKSKYSLILNRLKEIVKAVIFGYLLVGLIQGFMGGLGFWIFGVSSPIFWGIMMGFLALIPFLGTGLIWGPAAVFIFYNGFLQNSNSLMLKGIGLFVYGLIIVAGIDNLLRPMLISEKAKIHPLIIILGIFGGVFIFGPLGVIIGPLVLSLTSIILDTYLFDEEDKN